MLLVTPPFAHGGIGEVRERAQTRPDGVAVLVAVAREAEIPALAALCVQRVALVHLHARVGDRDDAEALLAQLRDQSRGVREALAVPREDAVAVHVVDVEVEHVARDLALAEAGGDRAQLVRAHVAPARLLVAERPQRRHRGPARQRRVAVEHVAGRRPAEDVVDEVAAGGGELDPLRIRSCEVDLDPAGVVEQQPVGAAVAQREHERDRRVEVVEGCGVARRRVDVPEHLVRAGLLEPARALAATEEPLARRAALDQPRPGFEPHAQLGVVGGEHRPVRVGEVHPQRVARHVG